ncbi:DUF3263 domain-containing protein [Gryllotalpicola ginsengisoli]|uniref:DUF3263 domain-containing protein n=1 Tax=Gryllotalpicola ginsengisoli TaxID=444608 RepID=UPI0003B78E2D|nr:DUF3263 domain-containing protein [Gryllotalpicola ginsengisoli]
MPHRLLTDREIAMLDFERDWRQDPGAKEQAIRSRFSLSPARYYQVLGRLIESPAALAYDPLLVKRLLRRRDERREARVARSRPID